MLPAQEPGSGRAPVVSAYPPAAGRLPRFPPPRLSLGHASRWMPRMGLIWDVSSGVAVLMEEAPCALGWHISWRGQRLWERV